VAINSVRLVKTRLMHVQDMVHIEAAILDREDPEKRCQFPMFTSRSSENNHAYVIILLYHNPNYMTRWLITRVFARARRNTANSGVSFSDQPAHTDSANSMHACGWIHPDPGHFDHGIFAVFSTTAPLSVLVITSYFIRGKGKRLTTR
jgi:hypothetical protein